MKIISCQHKHVNTVKTTKLLETDTSPQPKETNKQNIGVQQFLILMILVCTFRTVTQLFISASVHLYTVKPAGSLLWTNLGVIREPPYSDQ